MEYNEDINKSPTEILRSMFDVALICLFCRLFTDVFNLPVFSRTELEDALTDFEDETGKPKRLIVELFYRLCRDSGGNNYEKMAKEWEKSLTNKIKERYSCAFSSNPLKNCTFRELSIRQRVYALKVLVCYRLDRHDGLRNYINDKNKEEILKKAQQLQIRQVPIGEDDNGTRYWYFGDECWVYCEDYNFICKSGSEKEKNNISIKIEKSISVISSKNMTPETNKSNNNAIIINNKPIVTENLSNITMKIESKLTKSDKQTKTIIDSERFRIIDDDQSDLSSEEDDDEDENIKRSISSKKLKMDNILSSNNSKTSFDMRPNNISPKSCQNYKFNTFIQNTANSNANFKTVLNDRNVDNKTTMEYKTASGSKSFIESKTITGCRAVIESKSTIGSRSPIGHKSTIEPKIPIESKSTVGFKSITGSRSPIGYKTVVGSRNCVGYRGTIESKAHIGSRPTIGSEPTVMSNATTFRTNKAPLVTENGKDNNNVKNIKNEDSSKEPFWKRKRLASVVLDLPSDLMLTCVDCKLSFNARTIDPPLKVMPDVDNWTCFKCLVNGAKGWPIRTVRPAPQPPPPVETKSRTIRRSNKNSNVNRRAKNVATRQVTKKNITERSQSKREYTFKDVIHTMTEYMEAVKEMKAIKEQLLLLEKIMKNREAAFSNAPKMCDPPEGPKNWRVASSCPITLRQLIESVNDGSTKQAKLVNRLNEILNENEKVYYANEKKRNQRLVWQASCRRQSSRIALGRLAEQVEHAYAYRENNSDSSTYEDDSDDPKGKCSARRGLQRVRNGKEAFVNSASERSQRALRRTQRKQYYNDLLNENKQGRYPRRSTRCSAVNRDNNDMLHEITQIPELNGWFDWEKLDINEHPLRKICLAIVDRVLREEKAIVFSFPVNPIRDGCPDYFKYIKRPMDLTTVKDNVLKGYYKTWENFKQDMNLIWSNCATYNDNGSTIVDYSNYLSEFCKSMYRDAEQHNVEKFADQNIDGDDNSNNSGNDEKSESNESDSEWSETSYKDKNVEDDEYVDKSDSGTPSSSSDDLVVQPKLRRRPNATNAGLHSTKKRRSCDADHDSSKENDATIKRRRLHLGNVKDDDMSSDSLMNSNKKTYSMDTTMSSSSDDESELDL